MCAPTAELSGLLPLPAWSGCCTASVAVMDGGQEESRFGAGSTGRGRWQSCGWRSIHGAKSVVELVVDAVMNARAAHSACHCVPETLPRVVAHLDELHRELLEFAASEVSRGRTLLAQPYHQPLAKAVVSGPLRQRKLCRIANSRMQNRRILSQGPQLFMTFQGRQAGMAKHVSI